MSTVPRPKRYSIKKIAISFLHDAASGNVRKAFDLHIAPDFRHHNAYFKGDAESPMKGMEQNAASFPTSTLKFSARWKTATWLRCIPVCSYTRKIAKSRWFTSFASATTR